MRLAIVTTCAMGGIGLFEPLVRDRQVPLEWLLLVGWSALGLSLSFIARRRRTRRTSPSSVTDSPVTGVSDTARWVAVYRASETARPDSLFNDAFAEYLAGPRGRDIAKLMPASARNGWPIIARTKLIDDLVVSTVADGFDCVVNLAAGLDTRPYRLDLPESLRWIEVDLPTVIDDKKLMLADAQPRCRLVRIGADLTDAKARNAALQEAVAASTRTLILTEGLLLYLSELEVRNLAVNIAALNGVHSWVLDLASPAILGMMRKDMGAHLANAPLKFAPPHGVAYFEALGWRVARVHSILHAAGRLRRLPWFLQLISKIPEPNPRKLTHARWPGVIQLVR
jgi:methyltransferase (TIGR00027 family)